MFRPRFSPLKGVLYFTPRFSLVLLLGSSLAQALSGGHKAADSSDPLVKQIENASGYLAMIDTDPFERVEADSKPFLREGALTQEGCSAVYVSSPGQFLTSATCFAGEDGKLDPFRRFAMLFAQGKGYRVDPRSVVIHPEFNRNPRTSDLAVFSLEEDETPLYDKSHLPVRIFPENAYVTEGQAVTVLGLGDTQESGKDFGVAHYKQFLQMYPDPQHIQAAQGHLNLSSEEGLLTYVARNPGVNCKGDSGGGVFVQADVQGGKVETFLQAITIGKVSPTGNGASPCESMSRYLVGVDLRGYEKWISAALGQSLTQSKAAKLLADDFQKTQRRFFGRPLTHREIYLLPDEWKAAEEPFAQLSEVRRAAALSQHFNATGPLEKVRPRLKAIPNDRRPEAALTIAIPEANPYLLPGWIQANPSKEAAGGGLLFVSPGSIVVHSVRIVNTGDQPIQFRSALLPGYRSWVVALGQTLEPGQMILAGPNPYAGQIGQRIDISGVSGEGKLEVYVLPLDQRNSGKPFQDPLSSVSSPKPKPLVTLLGPVNPALQASTEERAWSELRAKWRQEAEAVDKDSSELLALFRSGKMTDAQAEVFLKIVKTRFEALKTQISTSLRAHNLRYNVNRSLEVEGLTK